MKFDFNCNEFLGAINNVARVVDSKGTMGEIYKNVLIESETDKSIRISAYNGETYLSTTFDCEVIESGSFAIMPKTLIDFVRAMPDEMATIEVNDRYKASIFSNSTKFSVSCMSSESFAKQTGFETDFNLVLKGEDFKKAATSVAFSVSKDDTRPVLQTVNFSVDNGKLTLVGCDGFRCCYRNVEIDSDTPNISINIHHNSINEIIKFCGDGEIKVSVDSKNPTKVIFTVDNTIIIGRLVVGPYINYKAIFNQKSVSQISVNSDVIGAMVTRSLLVSLGKAHLDIKVEGDNLSARAENEEMNFEDSIEVNNISKNDFESRYNPKFMSTFFATISNTDITLNFSGEQSPLIIRPVTGDEFAYLLLPIRR